MDTKQDLCISISQRSSFQFGLNFIIIISLHLTELDNNDIITKTTGQILDLINL